LKEVKAVEGFIFHIISKKLFYFIFRRKKIIGKGDKLDDKVKRIGPHIEIFQVFRERSKLKITKKTVKAIITLQAHVRGWLERRRFQRIKTKVRLKCIRYCNAFQISCVDSIK
jgi:hypothetical protein